MLRSDARLESPLRSLSISKSPPIPYAKYIRRSFGGGDSVMSFKLLRVSLLSLACAAQTTGCALSEEDPDALNPLEDAHISELVSPPDEAAPGPEDLVCSGTFIDHAHSGGVARERINLSFCDDGLEHISINLTDPLCDHRAAKVAWKLFDRVGLLASNSNTNGNGCNTTVTFNLPAQSDVSRIHTELKACNLSSCSSTESFDD